MNIIEKVQSGAPIHILGLMSGTSCDGLDMALTKISGSGAETTLTVVKTAEHAYSSQQKKHLLGFISQPSHSLYEVSQINFYLANLWAEMIKPFINALAEKDLYVDLIASHGQTLWHQPVAKQFLGRNTASTLQLGDPAVLAQLLGVPVVGDFRVADVALGGQGAPLIPYFDWVWFGRFKKNILAINIGGISNITYVSNAISANTIKAFDCGPGNMLIDGAMEYLFNKPYDAHGATAFSGTLNNSLLEYLHKKDSYSQLPPPKSTGRELYNKAFLEDIISFSHSKNIVDKDIIHTLSYYTALAIYNGFTQFINLPLQSLALAGGGSKNDFILATLETLFAPAKIEQTSTYNLDPDFKEAIGFAVLANETIQGKTANTPSSTGANKGAVLGKICLV